MNKIVLSLLLLSNSSLAFEWKNVDPFDRLRMRCAYESNRKLDFHTQEVKRIFNTETVNAEQVELYIKAIDYTCILKQMGKE